VLTILQEALGDPSMEEEEYKERWQELQRELDKKLDFAEELDLDK
jgi:hypothetical protein